MFQNLVFFNSVFYGCLCVLIALLIWLWWQKPSHKFPPGPRGFPLLGILPWLGKNPERVLKKWSQERYGPVMSARFGMEDVVVLNNFEMIQQAFVKQSTDFSGRVNIKLFSQIVGENFGIAMAKYDEKFKARKKFTLNALKKLGERPKAMDFLINEECDCIVDFLRQRMEKPILLKKIFPQFIGNVISRIVFGCRLEFNDPSLQNVLDIFGSTSFFVLLSFYEYVKNFPPFSTVYQKLVQTVKDVTEKTLPLIKEHKESFDENHIRDYIDAFIYKQKFGKDQGFSDEQMAVCVRDLFSGGIDTSSSLLSWMILVLLHFPEHLDKVVEEIDEVLGQDERPTMAQRNGMPFTCAFTQEVNRYLPMGPLALHITDNDVDLAGYHIPKGTRVMGNIWGTHFDAETWKDPFTFDPYRHIDEKGRFVPSKKVIPFSVGPRFCPGESIARMEIFLVLIRILQKFTITGTGEPLPSLLSGKTSIVHIAEPFEVILNER